jgi:hypothetical protein
MKNGSKKSIKSIYYYFTIVLNDLLKHLLCLEVKEDILKSG